MYLLNEYLPLLQRVFTDFPRAFDRNECFVLGCPYLPLMTVTNESDWLPGRGRICDPIRFSNASTAMSAADSEREKGNKEREIDGFAEIAAKYRRPLSEFNIPSLYETHPAMQCGVKPQLFLYDSKDKMFHGFPNWPTFVKMGFDTDYVTHYREDDCQNAVFGDLLPPK
jgi:hypothetical protein